MTHNNNVPLSNTMIDEGNLYEDLKIVNLHNKIVDLVGEGKKLDALSYEKSVKTGEIEPAYFSYEKGLDGGAATRGAGLLQINYRNTVKSQGPEGGVWEEAGAEIVRNEAGSQLQFFGHQGGLGSGFVEASTNASATWAGITSVTNDVPGLIENLQAPIKLYIAETFIRKSLLNGMVNVGNPEAYLINMYRADFDRRTELLLDEIATDSVVINTSVVGRPASTSPTSPIAQTILNLAGTLREKGAVNSSPIIDVHMNSLLFMRLLSERNNEGSFQVEINGGESKVAFSPNRNLDGSVSQNSKGYMGMINNIRVFVNHGVRKTYAVTGNSITGLTGGTKTALVMGYSNALGMGTGLESMNKLIVPVNALENIRRGVITINKDQFAGATPILPAAFEYAHFDA